mgnify:CR=1 FL=1
MKYLYRGFLIGLTCFMIVNYGISWILLFILYAYEVETEKEGWKVDGKIYKKSNECVW